MKIKLLFDIILNEPEIIREGKEERKIEEHS